MSAILTPAAVELHPVARRRMDLFLSGLDERMPGVFSNVFVVGSAALEDFCERNSDVGFVAAAAAALSATQLDALRDLHGSITADTSAPPLDGIYVTEQDLLDGPVARPVGPHAHSGRFVASGCHKRRPLDWHALAMGSVPLRGYGVEVLGIWRNQAELDRDLLTAADELVAETRHPALDQARASSAILGAARLHFTLLTGQVTNKTKAGLYGLIAFPDQWRPVLDSALAVRSGDAAAAMLSGDAQDFVQAVATDMHNLASTSARRPPSLLTG